jgi:hypothetical protein
MAQEPRRHDLVAVVGSFADYAPSELNVLLGSFAADAVGEAGPLPLAQGVGVG